MSEEQKAVETKRPEFADWWAICPKCKQRVSGSLAQIQTHKCEEPKHDA